MNMIMKCKVITSGNYGMPIYDEFYAKDINNNVSDVKIEVNNIDNILPTGSCSGSYKDGTSTINISPSDNTGIKNYNIIIKIRRYI